jgi:hypothetical protein
MIDLGFALFYGWTIVEGKNAEGRFKSRYFTIRVFLRKLRARFTANLKNTGNFGQFILL